MNASIRKFAALGAGALFLPVLGGCVAAFDPVTDPSSPAAARVQTLVEGNREYPQWVDFPRQTQTLPAPTEIAARVSGLHGAGEELTATAAGIQWLNPEDAQAYAEATRARIAGAEVSAPTAETLAEIEAFARRARDRGRAPPPIPRR